MKSDLYSILKLNEDLVENFFDKELLIYLYKQISNV